MNLRRNYTLPNVQDQDLKQEQDLKFFIVALFLKISSILLIHL